MKEPTGDNEIRPPSISQQQSNIHTEEIQILKDSFLIERKLFEAQWFLAVSESYFLSEKADQTHSN